MASKDRTKQLISDAEALKAKHGGGNGARRDDSTRSLVRESEKLIGRKSESKSGWILLFLIAAAAGLAVGALLF